MIDKYISRVKRLPHHLGFDNEEITALIERAQNGDESAKKNMVESCLLLVVRIAKSYQYLVPANSCLTLEDLVQEGNIGLITSLKYFKREKGMKFSSYASYWIKHTIRTHLFNYLHFVRLPMNLMAEERKARKATEELEQKIYGQMTGEELCDLGILARCTLAYRSVYLTDVLMQKRESKITYGDVLTSDYSAVKRSRQEDAEYLRHYLSQLTDKERFVLENLYGFDQDGLEKAESVARRLKLSSQRIRQLHNEAIAKIRKLIRREEFALYLNSPE